MTMESQETRVDGNAVAGTLGQIFVHEVSDARIACGGCGKVEPVGAEHAYTQAPGIVIRCCHCEDVLLVVTPAEDRYVLGFAGAGWLEIVT
jgi:hypothetical protein